VVAFSSKPLTLATMLGFFVAFLTVAVGCVYVGQKFFCRESMPTGVAPIILLVSLLGAFQLITVGIMGEYVGRIYEEVRKRPKYLLARSIDSSSTGSANSKDTH